MHIMIILIIVWMRSILRLWELKAFATGLGIRRSGLLSGIGVLGAVGPQFMLFLLAFLSYSIIHSNINFRLLRFFRLELTVQSHLWLLFKKDTLHLEAMRGGMLTLIRQLDSVFISLLVR